MAAHVETDEKVCRQDDLEHTLSSPFFWKSTKTCKFLTDAYNFIKEKRDEDISKFKRQLDSDALSSHSHLWHPKKNWELVLGKRHFEIITTKYTLDTKRREMIRTQLPNIRNNSVVNLLRLIRNKLSHNTLLTEDERAELNWFRERNGKLEFDEQLFTDYWSRKFPKLVPFLWLKFQQFSDYLKDFYPSLTSTPPIRNDSFSKIINISGQISNALSQQLENGMLEGRYSYREAPNPGILEFRTLSRAFTQKLLDGSPILEIEIGPGHVSSTWFSKSNGISEVIDQREIRMEFRNKTGLKFSKFYGTMFIVNTILDTIEYAELLIARITNEQTGRIIIFTNSEIEKSDPDLLLEYLALQHANDLGSKFKVCKKSVEWNELSQVTRDKLENEAVLSFQRKIINLRDILPEEEEHKETVFDELKGNLLNSLLRGEKVKLFPQIKIPSVSKYYIERILAKRIIVSDKIFHEENGILDTFVLSNVFSHFVKIAVIGTRENVMDVEDSNKLKASIRENPDCNIFFVKNDMHNFAKSFARFKRGSCQRNIHYLRYVHGNNFEWIGTKGSTAVLEANCSNFLIEKWKRHEDGFLKFLEKKPTEEQTIFISDKPGMGKSSVLKSLAGKITAKFNDRVVLLVTFHEFVEKYRRLSFEDENITATVVATILELFKCNEFEARLVGFWLTAGTNIHRKLKFEILLDGLDEVTKEMLDIGLNVLKIIHQQFPSVRVWASLRDHMLPLIYSEFGSENVCYQLEPFSKVNQIDFLERFWWERVNKFVDPDRRHSSQAVRDFAEKCIKVPLSTQEGEIAGIPLQCLMIGELLRIRMFCSELTLDVTNVLTIVNLYGKMMNRKFEVYVREKKGFPASISLDNPILASYRDHINLFLTYFAIQLLFSEETVERFRKKLLISKSHSKDLEKTVLEHGIIQSISPLIFLHRTFAEFIVAQFCCDVLNGEYLHIPENDPDFRNFLWNDVLAVTVNETESSLDCDYKHPTLCHFLNEVLMPKLPGLNGNSIYISDVTGLAAKGYYGRLDVAQVIKLAPLFVPVARKNHKGIMILLANSGKHLFDMFVAALVSQNYRYAKFLIEECSACAPQNWHRLQEFDQEKKFGILHWIVYGLFQTSEEPERNNVIEFIKYVVEHDISVLELKDAKGCTPLLLFLKGGEFPQDLNYLVHDLEMHKIFVEDLSANVLAMDNNLNTVLHFTHEWPEMYNHQEDKRDLIESFLQLFIYFMENGCNENTINSVNNKGQSPLFSAFEFFGDIMMPALTIFRATGARLNDRNADGNTILHLSIERKCRLAFMQKLIFCGVDLYEPNAKGQSAIQLAVEKDYVELVGMLLEHFHVDIEAIDKNGKTILQYAASTAMRNFIKFQRKVLNKKRKKREKNGLKDDMRYVF